MGAMIFSKGAQFIISDHRLATAEQRHNGLGSIGSSGRQLPMHPGFCDGRQELGLQQEARHRATGFRSARSGLR